MVIFAQGLLGELAAKIKVLYRSEHGGDDREGTGLLSKQQKIDAVNEIVVDVQRLTDHLSQAETHLQNALIMRQLQQAKYEPSSAAGETASPSGVGVGASALA